MSVDGAPPLIVIGFEGVWGFVLSVCVVYPVAGMIPGADIGGVYESHADAWAMVSNSRNLQLACGAFFVTVTGYNALAVYVTRYLSAIWHAILDNFRPVTIWSTDLFIFYILLPDGTFGEAWTPGSPLQLCGLIVLFIGTFIYNGSIKLPEALVGARSYAPEEDDFQAVARTDSFLAVRTPKNMASPGLGSMSPLIRRNSMQRKQDRTAGTGEREPLKGSKQRAYEV